MDNKAPRTYVDHLAWSVPTFVAVAGLILDHLNLAGSVVFEIWQRMFVNIWFVWLGLSVYGAFRLVRFVLTLNRSITESLPARLDTLDKRVETEAKSRVAKDDDLVRQIDKLDTRVAGELKDLREDARAEIAQAAQRESHQRADGINAVQRELEKTFERINRIEEKEKLPQSTGAAALVGRGMIHASARDLGR